MQAIRNSLLYKFFSLEVHCLQEQSGFIKNILQEVNSLYVEMLRYFKFMINLRRRPTLASWSMCRTYKIARGFTPTMSLYACQMYV